MNFTINFLLFKLKIMSTWKERPKPLSDRWFLTADTWEVLADDIMNKINFHTWIEVIAKTKWKEAR